MPPGGLEGLVKQKSLVNIPGPLASTVEEVEIDTIQRSDQLTTARRLNPDDLELRDNWFHTAYHIMFDLDEGGNVVVYLGTGKTSPFFRNPEAIPQLVRDKIYRTDGKEVVKIRKATSTLSTEITTLDLIDFEGGLRGFVINPSEWSHLNKYQQQVAERVYGSLKVKKDRHDKPYTDFEMNMEWMSGKEIETISIVFPNEEFIKEHAKEGPFSMATWISDFESRYSFYAGVSEVNSNIMLRGVLLKGTDKKTPGTYEGINKGPAQEIPAADAAQITSDADKDTTPKTLESYDAADDKGSVPEIAAADVAQITTDADKDTTPKIPETSYESDDKEPVSAADVAQITPEADKATAPKIPETYDAADKGPVPEIYEVTDKEAAVEAAYKTLLSEDHHEEAKERLKNPRVLAGITGLIAESTAEQADNLKQEKEEGSFMGFLYNMFSQGPKRIWQHYKAHIGHHQGHQKPGSYNVRINNVNITLESPEDKSKK